MDFFEYYRGGRFFRWAKDFSMGERFFAPTIASLSILSVETAYLMSVVNLGDRG